MPAILRRNNYRIWLNGNPAEAKAALLTYNARAMHAHAVSPRVNSNSVDDAGLIQPIH